MSEYEDTEVEVDWTSWFRGEVDRIEKNPPPAPEGMERVQCDEGHWPTYVAHVEGMYPAPCLQCIGAEDRKTIEALKHRTHRRWWKWGITRWFARHGYSLGIISGSSWGNMCGPCGTVTRLRWRGSRPYILGVQREAWGCLIKRHHRRATSHISAGLCTKCLPCPDCGSTDPNHYVCGIQR